MVENKAISTERATGDHVRTTILRPVKGKDGFSTVHLLAEGGKDLAWVGWAQEKKHPLPDN